MNATTRMAVTLSRDELRERLAAYFAALKTHDRLGGPVQRKEFEHATLGSARASVSACLRRTAGLCHKISPALGVLADASTFHFEQAGDVASLKEFVGALDAATTNNKPEGTP